MKRLFSATIAASLVLVSGQTIAKGEQDKPIIVQSAMDTQVWAAGVSKRLDRNLRIMSQVQSSDWDDGIIQIRFNVVDGDASDLHVVRSMGNPYVDSLAKRAVSRLRNLPDINKASVDRPVIANIILASDLRTLDQLTAELKRSERLRMASSDPAERNAIALNLTSRGG